MWPGAGCGPGPGLCAPACFLLSDIRRAFFFFAGISYPPWTYLAPLCSRTKDSVRAARVTSHRPCGAVLEVDPLPLHFLQKRAARPGQCRVLDLLARSHTPRECHGT